MSKSILKHLIFLFFAINFVKNNACIRSEQTCTWRSYKISALIFIFPHSTAIVQKQQRIFNRLWLSRPTNSQNTDKNSMQILVASTSIKMLFDRSTDVDRFSWEGRKIKCIHVLQMCERAIDFGWSLPSNYFLFFCSETNTDQRESSVFCVIQSSTSNTVLFIIFLHAIYNGVFSIGSLIAVC